MLLDNIELGERLGFSQTPLGPLVRLIVSWSFEV